MKKKFLIFFLLGLFLVTPLIGLAQFKLQQTYPSVGGSQLSQDVAASQSIPTLIKFLFNLAVWICILAAILTLIIGGIQYVASTGDVGKMTGAKTRIYSSLLGLTILIGAWFVLHTMNPSLVIPKITYTPIKQGIILFTHNGYCRFTGNYGSNCGIVKDKNVDESIINDLIQGGEAFRLNYDLPDLTKEFGELVVYGRDAQNKANELNFENFKLYAIGFWGTRESQSIVAFYPQKNYSDKAYYFSTLGAVDKDGKPFLITDVANYRAPEDNSNIKGFQLVKVTSGIIAPVEYFDVDKYVKKLNPVTNQQENTVNDILIYPEQRRALNLVMSSNQSHPPMSLKIIRSGPGVYLADANGNERYFDESARNFKDPSINFNQQAKTIKIINDIPERTYIDTSTDKEQIVPAEPHDFLVILHEGDNFSGRLRIYFQARMYSKIDTSITSNSDKSANKFIPAFNVSGKPTDVPNPLTQVFNDKYFVDSGFAYYKDYFFGHLPTLSVEETGPPTILRSTLIENITGDVKHSEIPPSTMVNEVIEGDIYGSKYGKIEDNKSISSLQIFELADDQKVCEEVQVCTEKQGRGYCLSYLAKGESKTNEANIIYLPMPVYLPVVFSNATDVNDGKWPIFTSPSGAQKSVSFFKAIKSISIKGKCVVVLFSQNTITSLFGPHSEVFTGSDYDLEDNEIGLCGSVGVFNRQIGRECASAIAVYPIK